MSRIWDWLKDIERRQAAARPGAHANTPFLYDRRSTERLPTRVPMFVYGHSTNGEPFYEATELRFVNALGGLITVQTAVAAGQKLLLTNRRNQCDLQCRVVGLRSRDSSRFAIAVAFDSPMPNLWTKPVTAESVNPEDHIPIDDR